MFSSTLSALTEAIKSVHNRIAITNPSVDPVKLLVNYILIVFIVLLEFITAVSTEIIYIGRTDWPVYIKYPLAYVAAIS